MEQITVTQVTITIDGVQVSIDAGATILDAAKKAGIEIPTLCHEPSISPSGNCRICVVEVEGSRTLVGSCHTPCAEGMVITTRSPRVLKSRQATIELLLTSHTGSCVTDTEARECTLHKLASDLEAGPPRFRVRKPRLYAAERVSPYLLRDMSKCILCRKCVRACTEIAGQNVYNMAYRGVTSKVVVDCDVPLNKEACKECGICIDYCPTSALMWPDGTKKGVKGHGARVKGEPAMQNGKREKLLGLLKEEERRAGYLSEDALAQIAHDREISVGDAYGTASFYSFLSTKPRGRHVIRICKSLPCLLKDAPMIIASVNESIGISPGETTPDGRFSFELSNCIGACDQAPAMLLDDTLYGNLTPGRIADILRTHRG
jgi:NADH:ubiquinone oxidoreductase subunit E/ferredoxin/NAD-dependent dihydropyrimidine dehydrogenase PreA subunit